MITFSPLARDPWVCSPARLGLGFCAKVGGQVSSRASSSSPGLPGKLPVFWRTGESVTCTHIACTLIGFVWETESQAGLLFLEGETEVGGLCFCLAVVRLCLRLCKGFLWPWRGEVAMEQRRMRPSFAFPCAEISSLPSPIRSWQKSQRCGLSACHPPHTCCLWHLLL